MNARVHFTCDELDIDGFGNTAQNGTVRLGKFMTNTLLQIELTKLGYKDLKMNLTVQSNFCFDCTQWVLLH